MITRFRVQNYKALRDVTLELTPMHLLIGPNDSGKTSILEALAALCRSVDRDLADAFHGAWKGDELVWHGSQEPVVTFESGISIDGKNLCYNLACRFLPSARAARIECESASHEGGIAEVVTSRGHSWSAIGRIIDHAEKIGSDDFRSSASLIHDALSGVHLYRWSAQHLALPVAPDSKRRFRMEPTGFGLALCLDDILGYDRNRFAKLESRFISIFPHIESIKLISEPAFKAPVDDPTQVLLLQKSDGKGVHFKFRGDAELVSASNVSDGLLFVLAYLTVLYLPEPPRVLLIEEPENGIHPARLEQVLTILRDLVSEQNHTQVVLTSHSPYVVSMFEPNEVTLCHKGDDGAVQVRRLSESETVRDQMNFFTLGEIWTAEGDDALMQQAQPVGD